jgi:hypothetical protein
MTDQTAGNSIEPAGYALRVYTGQALITATLKPNFQIQEHVTDKF